MATIAGNLHLLPGIMAIRAAVLAASLDRTAAGRMSAFLPGFCLWLFGELFHVHFAPHFPGIAYMSDASWERLDGPRGLLAYTIAVAISPEEAETMRRRAMRLSPKPCRRERSMDKTLADSFPASDPPSTIPNPCEDETDPIAA